MSSDIRQTKLDDIQTHRTATDGSSWSPGDDRDGRSCANCGAHVDADLARVLGDNDGIVHACSECCNSYADLKYRASNREHPGYQPGMEQRAQK